MLRIFSKKPTFMIYLHSPLLMLYYVPQPLGLEQGNSLTQIARSDKQEVYSISLLSGMFKRKPINKLLGVDTLGHVGS